MARPQGKLKANLRASEPLDNFDAVYEWLVHIGRILENASINTTEDEMRVRTDGNGAVVGVSFYEREESTDGG